MLTDTSTPGIQKLRVKGNVQLRPMLCKGPIHNDSEFTLLIGAIERDSCLSPDKADEKANQRKTIIVPKPGSFRARLYQPTSVQRIKAVAYSTKSEGRGNQPPHHRYTGPASKSASVSRKSFCQAVMARLSGLDLPNYYQGVIVTEQKAAEAGFQAG